MYSFTAASPSSLPAFGGLVALPFAAFAALAGLEVLRAAGFDLRAVFAVFFAMGHDAGRAGEGQTAAAFERVARAATRRRMPSGSVFGGPRDSAPCTRPKAGTRPAPSRDGSGPSTWCTSTTAAPTT